VGSGEAVSDLSCGATVIRGFWKVGCSKGWAVSGKNLTIAKPPGMPPLLFT